ncbi:MAG: hypothetical protein Tsb0020_27880 [Haliangiales bacterium]
MGVGPVTSIYSVWRFCLAVLFGADANRDRPFEPERLDDHARRVKSEGTTRKY